MPDGSASRASRDVAPETFAEDAVARGEIGLQAEEVLLRWVIARTHALLTEHPEEGLKALQSAAPGGPRSAVQRRFRAAIDAWRRDRLPEHLAPGLHVAGKGFHAAGYDILGLERRNGRPVAARYECKALPGARRIRLFVSANELAAYRDVHYPEEGTEARSDLKSGLWRLVGINPVDSPESGRITDLTSLLSVVLEKNLLAPLRAESCAPDGLRLYVERPHCV